MIPIFLRNRSPGHLPRSFIIAALFLLGILIHWRYSNLATLTGTKAYSLSTSTYNRGRYDNIPPIVHFVQLKQQQETSTELHFSFEAFLALYAAYRSIRPTTIYIHTDFTPDEIASAREQGSSWTRKILGGLEGFPGPVVPGLPVRLHHVTPPTHTPDGGHAITRVEHRSDFVRLDALARFGGIYLDWDVLTLRPLTPLLNAGFRAVVGRQFDTFINNGIMLASRDSELVRIMREETPRVFDGGWITHSVGLLTTVAERLAAVPAEVLIMDFKAFSPFSWEQASVNMALERHEGAGGRVLQDDDDDDDAAVAAAVNYDVEDSKVAWETRRVDKKGWEYDFSDAYFLHSIFNSVENPKGFNGVNVPYILARDSNYAIAAWPIVIQGIKDGFIDRNDDTF